MPCLFCTNCQCLFCWRVCRKSGKEHSSAFSNLLFHYDEGLVSVLQILREVDRLDLDARGSTLTTSEDRSRLFVTGRREVRTTSSTLRSMWWSRERVTNVTRHMRQGSHIPMGLKNGVVGETSQKALVQEHRAPCLQQHARMSFGWRRASHFVSFRCLGCVNIRSHCE